MITDQPPAAESLARLTGSANGGMELRDYIAAQIANGLLAQQDIGAAAMAPHHDGNGLHHTAAEKLARIAYLVADAMLKERQRSGRYSQSVSSSAAALGGKDADVR